MRDQVLVTPGELAAEPRGRTGVLHATVDLGAARFDGDYRVRPGREDWVRRRVPGSAHLDLLTDFADDGHGYHFARPSRSVLLAGLVRLGVGDRRIVVYDDGRMQWAARAWWMLRCAGVDARVLDGGLAAWAASGLPVEASGHPVGDGERDGAVDAPPRPGAGYDGWADLDEVAAISAGKRPGTLVCALSPDQFVGAAPSRYARRGHIPGSRNLPAATLLAPGNTVLPVDDVRAVVDDQLAGAGAPIVVYCGGGISACVTALGLTLAGHRDVKVYDGSLEEWAADPALPLVTSAAPRQNHRDLP